MAIGYSRATWGITAASDDQGIVYFFGGHTGSDINTIYRLNPNDGALEAAGSLPWSAESIYTVSDRAGKIYVINVESQHMKVALYDPSNNSTSILADIPAGYTPASDSNLAWVDNAGNCFFILRNTTSSELVVFKYATAEAAVVETEITVPAHLSGGAATQIGDVVYLLGGDADGLQVSYLYRVVATQSVENTPPVLEQIPDQNIDEHAMLEVALVASDADIPQQALSFALSGQPYGMLINAATGLITWLPDEGQGPGSYSFVAEVSDGTATDSVEISVTVNEVNEAPVLATIGDKDARPNDELSFVVRASDMDLPEQALSYTLRDAPAGAVIDLSSGVFQWTPTEAQADSSFTFTVQVSDGELTDSEVITITVEEFVDPQDVLMIEEFSGNLSAWNSFGSPSPIITDAQGRIGVLDTRGDSNWNSGIWSKEELVLEPGMVITLDVFLDISDPTGCWTEIYVGMNTGQTTGQPEGQMDARGLVGFRYDGDACWATDPEYRRHASFNAYGIGRELAEAADDYIGAWRELSIEILDDYRVRATLGETLVSESFDVIDPNYRSGFLQLFGRSSGSAGKTYMDNLIVRSAALPENGIGTLKLVSAQINGVSVSSEDAAVRVLPGTNLAGTITVDANNLMHAGAVVPLGGTVDWGDRTTQAWKDYSDIPVGTGQYVLNVSKTAPKQPGIYHIIVAFSGEYNMNQVISRTNWTSGPVVWNDGNDVGFDWTREDYRMVKTNGAWYGPTYQYNEYRDLWMPATYITIEVVDSGDSNFSEDWESGIIDPVKWHRWGSPSPSVVDVGGDRVWTSNGDANFESGIVSVPEFSFEPGLSIEFDMYVNDASWSVERFYLATGDLSQWPETGVDGNGPSHLGPTIQVVGYAAWGQEIGLYGADGWVSFSPLLGQWVNYRVLLNMDGSVSYFVNGSLTHTTAAGFLDYSEAETCRTVFRGRSPYGARNMLDNVVVRFEEPSAETVDLQLSELIAGPSAVTTRQFTSCRFTLANNGPADLLSEFIMVDYYLSANTTFGDGDDVRIGDTGFTISLAGGAAQVIQLSSLGLRNMVDIWPTDLADGDYYLFADVRIKDGAPADPTPSNNFDRTAVISVTTVTETAPQVSVNYQGMAITAGDSTPTDLKGSDFGVVNQGVAPVARIYTVTNTGTATLTTGSLRVPTGFTVTEGLSSSILAGSHDTFTVQLDTAIAGVKSGGVSFETNDASQSLFTFSITGIVEEQELITQPDWQAPLGLQNSMIIHATVNLSGVPVTHPDSLLSAWSGDEIRGVAQISSGPAGEQFQLNVFSNATSESGLTYQIFDGATGEIVDVVPTIDFVSDAVNGLLADPLEMFGGDNAVALDLVEGWNWISINVNAATPTIGNIFQGGVVSDNDLIKSSSESATYYNGQWYPGDYELEAGRLYKMHRNAPGSEKIAVIGTPVDLSDPAESISLVSGWNWIGYNGSTAADPSVMTHGAEFVDNDIVKGQAGSATYFGGIWYAQGFELEPGKGYLLKVANSGELAYSGLPSAQRAETFASPSPMRTMAASGWSLQLARSSSAPAWEQPQGLQNSMIVHAKVESAGIELSEPGSRLAAFAGDELRGVADIYAGPGGNQFQLNIYSNTVSEAGITLKVYVPSIGVIDIVETVAFQTDLVIGLIHEPTTFSLVSAPTNDSDRDGIADDWVIEHFGSIEGFDGALDTDGDSYPNIIEYFSNLDPNLPDAGPIFEIISRDGAQHLRYRRSNTPEMDLLPRFESKVNLSDAWLPLSLTPSLVDTDDGYDWWEVSLETSSDRRFYRMVIEANP